MINKYGTLCSISIAIIYMSYASLPHPYAQFDDIVVIKDSPLEGPLSPNNFLDDVERLHEDVLIQPESIAFRSSEELFVSVYGGDIVKVYGPNFEKLKVVANNGPGCAGFWEEAICGRPLGMKFHTDGLLYVIDAYLGVFTVDVDTGESRNIFNLSEPIEGVLPMLADDLDFDKDGNIYWSDASTVVNLDSGALEIYANPSGRLIKYDITAKKQTVILDHLHFPNGVQVSPDKDFVLVNELQQKRTLRYWLEGPNAGTSDVFVAALPGMPDNIRPRPQGGYYIAIVSIDDPFHHLLSIFFGSRPALKRFLYRITLATISVAEVMESIIPNVYCKRYLYEVFSLHCLTRWSENNKAIVVEVDETGNILGSMQGTSGKVKRITEAQRVGDSFFFGSAFTNYLGRIKMTAVKESRKEPKLIPNKEEL